MSRIKLIGINGDKNYEAWRENTKEALQNMHLSESLEEVNRIDAILEFDIVTIPAIVFDDTILMQKNNHIPDAAEIQESIQEYLNKQTLAMKKIILPTDFSNTAHNAYLYASDMADYVGAQLKVVNVSYPDQSIINGVIPSMEELAEYRKGQLIAFVRDRGQDAVEEIVESEMIDKEVIIGFPREEILKLSSDKNTDLILMGTTGSGNALTKWFGSTSSEVSLRAKCPVWLVPPGATFDGIKNILYAGNYESANPKLLNDISTLAKQFGANTHLIHVVKEESLRTNPVQEVVLEELFKKAAPDLKFKSETVVSDKVWEGLDNYAQENNVDLIVIVNKKRGFWEKMGHTSVTKKMVFQSKVPILILHSE